MFSLFWPIKCLFGLVKLLFGLLVLLSCVFTLTALMGDRGWLWSLTTHFRVQYLILQGLALLLLASQWMGKKSSGQRIEGGLNFLVLLLFAGINLAAIAPYYLPLPVSQTPSAAEQPTDIVKLMHMNLFGRMNSQYEEVVTLIREENPDVLDLVEYSENWQHHLERSGVLKRYPYRVAGQSSIALYSKRPLKNARLVYASGQGKVSNQANIIATITVQHQPVTILAAHPASPVRPSHLTWLQASFSNWQTERKKLGKNLLVVGDLNTSPWSAEFQQLTTHTGLRDSQLSLGLQPSWPMRLLAINTPNLWTHCLQIPIDHVLVSNRLVILNRHTGPFIGSDHLPVVVVWGVRRLAQ